jgi:hypothetical protein
MIAIRRSGYADSEYRDNNHVLVLDSPARQIPHAPRGPAEFSHHFRQASVSASVSIALRDFKKVQQRLRGDTFQLIEKVNFATHTLKREPPRIDGFCHGSFRCFFS